MNNQEIFDTVARHLIKQGRPAKNELGECAYRTDGGLSCAVGCLIPDALYDPRIEGTDVDAVLRHAASMLPGVTRGNISLLRSLQITHDAEWEDESELKANLLSVAFAHGLSAAAVTP
jgi:hypothetical protein